MVALNYVSARPDVTASRTLQRIKSAAGPGKRQTVKETKWGRRAREPLALHLWPIAWATLSEQRDPTHISPRLHPGANELEQEQALPRPSPPDLTPTAKVNDPYRKGNDPNRKGNDLDRPGTRTPQWNGRERAQRAQSQAAGKQTDPVASFQRHSFLLLAPSVFFAPFRG